MPVTQTRPNVLRKLIKRNEIRERRLFSDGYREIYRRTLHQIESLIRNHPVLTTASVVIPTHAIGSIVIPMEEAKKYVIRQLLKEKIHVIDQHVGDNTILVTWMATTMESTTSINSGRTKKASITIHSSSSSETESSSSSSVSGSPTTSATTTSLQITAKPRQMPSHHVVAPPPLKLTNKIPDLVNNNLKREKTKVTKTPSAASIVHGQKTNAKSNKSKLSAKDEETLARLHTGVLRAATAC